MPKPPTVERLYSQEQIADMFGLHVCTIIRARRAGELRAVKFGRAVRLRESDVLAWIQANEE